MPRMKKVAPRTKRAKGPYAAIGDRLEKLRRLIGDDQQKFAAKAKLSQNQYNQWERGKKRPSLDDALKLCDTYNVTLDWIYRGDPSGLGYQLANDLRDLRQP